MNGPDGAAPGPAPQLFRTEIGESGSRVVLLHGLFGQGKNWLTVAKTLSAQHRVLLVDLPNHGRSAWTDRFSYLDLADALAYAIAESPAGTSPARAADRSAGATEPVAVIGHSMGGKVAMALALRHPELVSRLVVVDVSPVRMQRLSSFADYVAGMRSLELTTLSSRAAADERLVAAVPDPVIRGFLLQNLRRDGAGWRWQMNLQLLGDRLTDVADWPELDVAPYPGPVLWLAGANSDYVRGEYAPAMRALFPRVQLVTVKNSGHWVHADQPEVFLHAVRRFLHPGPPRQPNHSAVTAPAPSRGTES